MSKIKIVGIFLLAVCLSFLYPARTTEAAIDPQTIVDKLNIRLNTILVNATTRKLNLGLDVEDLINRYNNGDISRTAFCSNIDRIQTNASNARDKFDRKIVRAWNKSVKTLYRIGAEQSYIDAASDLRDDATAEKEALYDALDTEIDNAEQVPSPWCT